MANSPARERREAERRGRFSETLAALFLGLKGYRTVARRVRTPVGEIDLVMRRGRTLVFVEVKRRGTLDDGIAAVGPGSARRILRAAEFFVARHPEAAGMTLRFDIVAIAPGRLPRHLVDAFSQDRR